MSTRQLRQFVQAHCWLTLVFFVASLFAPPDASAQYKFTPLQKRLISGPVSIELDLQGQRPTNMLAPFGNAPSFFAGLNLNASLPLPNYFPVRGNECNETIGTNTKVNQNCLNITDPEFQGRAQALDETTIAQDPNHPNHLVGASNDYQVGDAFCATFYSLDGGQHWHDSTPPANFTRGAAFGGVIRQYWQAGSDPAVAWDSKGNVYLACIAFQRGDFGLTSNPDLSSAVYVFRSTLNNGASWNFPGRPVVEFNDLAGTGCCLEDKSYLTVDNHVGSPFQDRVYVTWQFIAGDGTIKIYESFSNDFGESFSPPVLVSTPSPLCPISVVGSGNCDASFFSQPFTSSDGTLYVIFKNVNNAVSPTPVCGSFPCDNRNQILLAKSTDGGVSFGPPVKVADYYDSPDCATYQGGQDFPQGCFPEKGTSMRSVFRSGNYAVGAAHPKYPNTVIVTFGSYINIHSNESNGCVPAGLSPDSFGNLFIGVKTAGACNNDILISASNDGGKTFTGGATDPRLLTSVNQAKGQDTTDQFWQWAAFTRSGELVVSYYDRNYGDDETTGSMDISLSGSYDIIHFRSTRVTSSSMPTPTQFPDPQGNSVFFGDYAGLSVVDDVHPALDGHAKFGSIPLSRDGARWRATSCLHATRTQWHESEHAGHLYCYSRATRVRLRFRSAVHINFAEKKRIGTWRSLWPIKS